MNRALIVTSAALLVIAVTSFAFTYAVISTLCDDTRPNWA
jgi:hypothetical protein